MDFLMAFLGQIFATELEASAPRIAAWLINRAASRLPSDLRDRYLEEWLAHAAELSGALSKIIHGLGCLRTARAVGRAARAETFEVTATRFTARAIFTIVFGRHLAWQ